MNNMNNQNGKEKLVVEIVAAHNLMPKDGEGSSSPFVEVEFENQRLRTQVKYKDLNPVWNEKLVFRVNDVADIPYRTVELNVFNERRSSNSRNFLGKVRVSGSSVAKEGEQVNPQLHTLDKRSLFSHVRGEITLKLYVSTSEEYVSVKEVTKGNSANNNNNNNNINGMVMPLSKKNKKLVHGANNNNNNNNVNSNNIASMTAQQQQQMQNRVRVLQENNVNINVNGNNNNNNNKGGGGHVVSLSKPAEPGVVHHGDLMKPVVIPGPVAGGFAGMYGRPTGAGEFSLRETRPQLGGAPQQKDKTSSTYDLVEQMQYLYVRVVRARDVGVAFGGGDLVAEVKLGNYRGITKRVGSNTGGEWDQVFAFSKDCIQSSVAEVFVRESNKDNDFIGRVWFDLSEVPRRVPPDSQLAPQWYRMEDRKGDKSSSPAGKAGEVMVSIWFGTQADEAFAEAWHSKAASVNFDGLCSIKSKVYLSPKLWYLRVSVLEAQDIVPAEKTAAAMVMRFPELSVRAQVGNQVLRTRVAQPTPTRSPSNPCWNEEMMFVAADPFEDYLFVCVEDRVGPGRDDPVGRVILPLAAVEKRNNEKPVASRWFNLDSGGVDGKTGSRFGSRLHLRVSLDGGYHVLDEATSLSSDVRPTEKHLWKSRVGVLEMGILGATGLVPAKIKEGRGGSTDAYCVAKYGQKWVRTRTVVDSLSPKWNEQYTWEVFDPCTVITVGVFDNARVEKNGGGRDSRIGKVRIRLSTLETDRVYTHSYPLLMLHTSGVKKMGELHLAVRFSCTNMGTMLNMYATPLLPKMHYVNPLGVGQLESLRHQAVNVVAARLSRAEPPLGREVVEYMLDHDSALWSMRRSKANFFRLTAVLSGIAAALRWAEAARDWRRPVHSALSVALFLALVAFPELAVPSALLYLAFLGLWRYRTRPRHPPHMDTRVSNAEHVYADELDEEFDTFPSSRGADVVRMRYDRLRSVAGRIQTVVGDMASQGERFQALISWRDPRASFLFVMFCLVAAVGFYAVPLRLVVALWGLYVLRPPRFRSKLPCRALSFFRRLPTRADSML